MTLTFCVFFFFLFYSVFEYHSLFKKLVHGNVGEGVSFTYATFYKEATHRLDFCACVELQRQISSSEVGDFEVVTSHGQDGIMYPPSNSG